MDFCEREKLGRKIGKPLFENKYCFRKHEVIVEKHVQNMFVSVLNARKIEDRNKKYEQFSNRFDIFIPPFIL